jgi:hypothetical protein
MGPMRRRVLDALTAAAPDALTIQEIARGIGHHTTTPWEVASACRGLERDNRVIFDRTTQPWRVRMGPNR